MWWRIGDLYLQANKKSPLLTQGASAGIIACIGDVTMQHIERESRGHRDGDDIEWERTSRLCLYRSCIFAPGYVVWLGMLERMLGSSSVPWVVAKKVFMDQAVWTPPSMVVLYSWMGLTEHMMQGRVHNAASARNMAAFYDDVKKGARRGYERAVDCLWPTLRVNWPVVRLA